MDPFTLIFALSTLVASYWITSMIQTKTETQKPATLEEFDFPQIEEGTPQCVIFGDVWVSDWAVLWYGNLRTSAIKSDGSKK